jgi:hypothetical protein
VLEGAGVLADPLAARAIERSARREPDADWVREPDEPATGSRTRRPALAAPTLTPIDWSAFWAKDSPAEEWLAEPFLPAGRQVGIYSTAKTGKSLFTLDVVAAGATNRPMLGQAAVAPFTTIYLDLEMTEEDLRERLSDLGYGPDDDLSRLVYFQLPDLPPLDTRSGGEVLAQLVSQYQARLVVVDTTARGVHGDENDADTIRNFYRHTGRHLKESAVSLLRLDHAGKDLSRGQRGSSSKDDDLDVVFRLGQVEDKLVLTRTRSRVPWVPAEIALRREEEPHLRHVLADGIWPAGTQPCAEILDRLDVALDASVSMAMKALKSDGNGRRKAVVMAALKWRRIRS